MLELLIGQQRKLTAALHSVIGFATVATAATYSPSAPPEIIATAGDAAASDGKGLVYRSVVSEPTSFDRRTYSEGSNLRASGSAIGNMTAGGGLAAAFDNSFSKTMTSAARGGSSIPRFAGRTLGSASRIYGAYVHGSSDHGFLQDANTEITVELYGKTGSAPSTASNGTLLGTISFTDQDSALARFIPSNDPATEWDHIWITITGDGSNNVGVSQVAIMEADATDTHIDPEKLSIDLDGGGTQWYEGVYPSHGQQIAFGRTPQPAELISTLPVAAVGTASVRRVAISLPVYVVAGDLIEVTAEAEFSSNEGNGGSNIGVWSFVGLTAAPGQVVVGSSYEITESNGRNITPQMHHDTHVHAGALIAPATGLYYVSLIAWAASNVATTNITVEQDYGHITVKRTRGLIRSLLD